MSSDNDLENYRNKIAELQERIDDITRLVSDWVWETDTELNFSYVSDRVFELLNIHPFDIIGQNIGNQFTLSNGADTDSEVNWRSPFRDLKMTTRTIEGDELILLVSGLPKYDSENGSFLGVRGTARDITKEEETNRELNVALDKAETANSAKTEFLSSMSHELRTPMNAILGFGQLLEMNPVEPLSEMQLIHTRHILKAGDHLLDLINQVLELSMIESSKVSLFIENVAPTEIILESLALVQTQAEDKNIELIYSPSDVDLPLLKTDRNRACQVLLNLLSNAIKYNRKYGKVTVAATVLDNGFLRLSVSDTGLGIPKQQQGGLFEPFERLGREAGEIEGTGIGLTITKRITELLDGVIGFDSEENVGSVFWIDLPISDDQLKGNDPSQAELFEGKNAGTDGAEGVILYIEDNPANLRLMQAVISGLPNLTMRTAPTAELGLNLARNLQPNLILMDVNLPGMNGIQALNNLRGEEETKNIPVIAISAAAMPHEIQRGKEAGFEAYITKPIKVPEVIKAINERIG